MDISPIGGATGNYGSYADQSGRQVGDQPAMSPRSPNKRMDPREDPLSSVGEVSQINRTTGSFLVQPDLNAGNVKLNPGSVMEPDKQKRASNWIGNFYAGLVRKVQNRRAHGEGMEPSESFAYRDRATYEKSKMSNERALTGVAFQQGVQGATPNSQRKQHVGVQSLLQSQKGRSSASQQSPQQLNTDQKCHEKVVRTNAFALTESGPKMGAGQDTTNQCLSKSANGESQDNTQTKIVGEVDRATEVDVFDGSKGTKKGIDPKEKDIGLYFRGGLELSLPAQSAEDEVDAEPEQEKGIPNNTNGETEDSAGTSRLALDVLSMLNATSESDSESESEPELQPEKEHG